ncbi:MAG: DUF4339 domain-containing protein, partial [Planctomycetales bacterium]|nr:DUF4339 domain-containing protein [Planctomycetales bacterium]
PAVDAWYVRPAGGGQYGPATTEVFRTWLAEGRVPADAWVWRDGWPDWKPAAEAASTLDQATPSQPAGAPQPPAAAAPQPAAVPVAAASTPPTLVSGAGETLAGEAGFESPAAAARRAKLAARRRRNKQITIVLAVLAFVLLTVLAVVLWRG